MSGYIKLGERLGVTVAASDEAGYDESVFYESSYMGQLVWGDLEFGNKGEKAGRKSYMTKLVTQRITRIITITPLVNHNTAGVIGCLYSLAMGSMDNFIRFENDAKNLAEAVPEIIARPQLGDRVTVNIVDALVCQYEGENRGLLHYSTPLNELRFSRDPVAMDVMSVKELQIQRRKAKHDEVKPNETLLQNAAMLEIGVCEERRIRVLYP
jgi:hypothetical protein